jgi:hypothetical protein
MAESPKGAARIGDSSLLSGDESKYEPELFAVKKHAPISESCEADESIRTLDNCESSFFKFYGNRISSTTTIGLLSTQEGQEGWQVAHADFRMDEADHIYVTALKTNKQEAKVELQIWNAETATLQERLVLAEAADVA